MGPLSFGLDLMDKQISEYAMALDLLGKMNDCTSEKEANKRILDLFIMLFSPKRIVFLSYGRGGNRNSVYAPFKVEATCEAEERLMDFTGMHSLTPSGTGFIFKIHCNSDPLGVIELDELAFPQYLERYLNLALSIGHVCGLVIENARRYETIIEQKNNLSLMVIKLEKTRDQLVESKKMAALGTLVAGVAHEINTPVGVCITAISAMLDRKRIFEKKIDEKTMKRRDLHDFMQFSGDTGGLVLKNLRRAADLINGFKQVSVDQMTEQQRTFCLAPYFDDVVRSLKPRFGNKQVQISLSIPDTLEVNSYPGLYAQILTNLLINSFIHGYKDKDSGTIMIIAEKQKEHLLIQYRDDGNGMTAESLNRMFDPFFTTNKETGTGLGMHIVYNIITQKLKGTITCQSSPGNGVIFNIHLSMKREL